MRKLVLTTLACVALALAAAGPAMAGEAKSLRGDLGLAVDNQAPELYQIDLSSRKIERTYKQQPPLIPHKVEKYTIDIKNNRCLKCHDKKNYEEEDAPMAGKSHYVDAQGKTTETLNMGRYFCTQCHVPQMKADQLVENTFVGAK